MRPDLSWKETTQGQDGLGSRSGNVKELGSECFLWKTCKSRSWQGPKTFVPRGRGQLPVGEATLAEPLIPGGDLPCKTRGAKTNFCLSVEEAIADLLVERWKSTAPSQT